ncbi:hypothetical protein O9992_12155 [Vibrio lentus]|nr:hypothetical protein [Vibrio lentus]
MVLVSSLMFALIGGAKVAGVDVSALKMLPLFEIGMGWFASNGCCNHLYVLCW